MFQFFFHLVVPKGICLFFYIHPIYFVANYARGTEPTLPSFGIHVKFHFPWYILNRLVLSTAASMTACCVERAEMRKFIGNVLVVKVMPILEEKISRIIPINWGSMCSKGRISTNSTTGCQLDCMCWGGGFARKVRLN